MQLNDYDFEIKEKGNGEPVIFVHGSVSDHRTWVNQVEKFSTAYRVVTYSRRYHSPNVKIKNDEDYSMDQHVLDLEQVVRKIDDGGVHLIGHSYGAFVCVLLAIKAPDLVKSLVLAEPPIITLFVSNNPKPLEIIKLLFTRPKTAIALIKLGAKGIDPATKEIKKDNIDKAVEIFGKATLGEDFYLNLSEERMEQVKENVIKAEFLGSGFPPVDNKQLRNINIPTLLLYGEKSPKIFPLLLDRLQELMPRTILKVVSGASHISHEDNFLAYNEKVLAFLESLQ